MESSYLASDAVKNGMMMRLLGHSITYCIEIYPDSLGVGWIVYAR